MTVSLREALNALLIVEGGGVEAAKRLCQYYDAEHDIFAVPVLRSGTEAVHMLLTLQRNSTLVIDQAMQVLDSAPTLTS